MLRRFYCIAIAVLLVGCTEVPPKSVSKPQEVEIRIDNFAFSPASATIAPGTKVTWVNHDDVPHTATSTSKAFTSAALDTDEKFSFVFTQPGTFPYYCAVHPHMTGQI